MSTESPEELLDDLAASFVECLRSGQKPSIDEYAQRHPELADRIRTLLTTMAEVEQVGCGGLSGVGRATILGAEPADKELGDYRILREVGRGGMGIVYEAEQKSLGRRVALKVLPVRSLLDQRQLERFRHEARAAARLHHPNIVPVFGVGEHDGAHFFAMQFIQGQGLDDVLVELRKLRRGIQEPNGAGRTSEVSLAGGLLSGTLVPDSEMTDATAAPESGAASGSPPGPKPGSAASSAFDMAWESSGSAGSQGVFPAGSSSSARSAYPFYQSVARIIVQAAEALDYAHQQRLLHRDVKPSNLILDLHGNIWVTDFGLVKDEVADGLTHSGELVGTLRYMAPERFRGWCDARSDVYSLGLTLYELLTLQAAFESSDRAMLIRQIAADEPSHPRRIDPQIPRDLETVVLKSIAKEPAQRYRSAGHLAEDLRRFLDGKPILARRTPAREQFALWCRRNPVVAGLSCAITVLMLLAVVATTLAAIRFGYLASARQEALQEKTNAERLATERLFESLLARARAERFSGRVGRRFESLKAIKEAGRLARALNMEEAEIIALRNEAIASMPLLDLQMDKQWPGYPPLSEQIRLAFDRDLDRYARLEPNDKAEEAPSGEEPRVLGDVVVRRMSDNRELQRFPGLGYMFRRPYLRFSPDGRLLASFGIQNDGPLLVQVWELDSGRKLLETESRGPWYGANVDFSPDSGQVACVGADASLWLHDLEQGARRKLPPATPFQEVRTLRFAPDGEQLAVSNGREVRILNLTTNETRPPCVLPAVAKSVAWSPDGAMLGVTYGTKVSVIDVATGQVRSMAGEHKSWGLHVFFNHRGDILASTAWDVTTRFWDPWSGEQLLQSGQYAVACSSDGRRIGWGTAGSSIGRWNVATGGELSILGMATDNEKTSSISPDGELLAVATAAGVQIWDLALRKEIGAVPLRGISFLQFNQAGDAIWMSAKDGLARWPIRRDGDNVVSLGPPEALPSVDGYELCAFSPDEAWVALASQDHSSRKDVVLRGSRGSDQGQRLAQDAGRSAAFSPDSQWLATAGRRSGVVRIWQVKDGTLAKRLPVPGKVELAFSSDGRWLATAGPDETLVWNVPSWELKLSIPRTLPGESGAVAFDRACRQLAVPESPHSIRLVDLESGAQLATLQDPHAEPLFAFAFARGGTRLMAAPHRGRVRVWNLTQVRRQLAAMGLDWSGEPLPPPTQNAPQPLKLRIHADPEREYRSHFHAARRLAALKKWQEAVQEYNRALDVAPQRAEAFAGRGAVFYQLHQWDKAIRDVTCAVKLDPDGAVHWHNLGFVHFQKTYLGAGDPGGFNTAVRHLAHAARLDPENGAIQLALGRAKRFLGDYEGAIAHLEYCTRDSERAHRAWEILALAYIEQGDSRRAAVCAMRAVDSFPKCRTAARYRALVRVFEGDEARALRDADVALAEMGASHVPAWVMERELEIWSAATASHPDSATARFGRAATLAQLNRWDEGLADMRRAVQLHSGPPPVRGKCLPVKLDSVANYPLKAGRDFSSGEQELGGVVFHIGEKQIRRSAEGIAVNQLVAKIHFLHNAHAESGRGTRIGEYRIRYEDGSVETAPLVLGENISPWDSLALGSGSVAWVGTNEDSRRRVRWIHLRRMTWPNPHPQKLVTAIDIVSSGKESIPFCAAITVEQPAAE